MSSGSVDFNLSVLDKFEKQLSTGTYVKVGIMGDKASREDDSTVNNVELGVIHELGSLENNIPPRSWLRMPLETHEAEIVKFVGSKVVANEIMKGEIEKGLSLVGVFAENIIQQAFSTRGFGKWKPLKPETVDRKGSSMPLIDTSEMRRAVSSEVVEGK